MKDSDNYIAKANILIRKKRKIIDYVFELFVYPTLLITNIRPIFKRHMW